MLIVIKEHITPAVFLSTNRELVSCDYYDFWSGKADAISRFDGRFMSDYAWAESAIYRMCEKKGLS